MLQLQHVSKKFERSHALNGLTLTVNRGEIYGLLGPNGAGKSTTINLICGLLRADEGTIRVAGFDPAKQPQKAKQGIGVVPQELALYSELNCCQNLRFFGQLYGLRGSALDSRIDELLALVHLSSRKYESVTALSGGMQRRLNIAVGLLQKPALILMDEPTVGLDPQNRANILEIVKSVAASGAAVLYSTHYMVEVESICNRIGIIDRGSLLTEGTLDELRKQSGSREILTLRGSFDASLIASSLELQPGDQIRRSSPDEIVVELSGADSRLPALLAGAATTGTVREVLMSRQSLESLFIQLTGRELRE